MTRTTLIALLIVVLVYADEDNSCVEPKDCSCGSICNAGICEEGCMVYGAFLAAGSAAEIYGRKCRCGTVIDERGHLLECEKDVEFTGAPEGVAEWENNPSCEGPHPATAAPSADFGAFIGRFLNKVRLRYEPK